ncbi:MAG: hypothetical protein R2789_06795 [Microthrixaceae bacterium]
MEDELVDRFTPVARVTSPSAIVLQRAQAPRSAFCSDSGCWAQWRSPAWDTRSGCSRPFLRRGSSSSTAISPRSLDQPWKGAVEQVQNARRNFDAGI